MNNPYYNYLLQLARVDLPTLVNDLDNASTPLAQQQLIKQLTSLVSYLLYATIYELQSKQSSPPAPPPQARSPHLQVMAPVSPVPQYPYQTAPAGYDPRMAYPPQQPQLPPQLQPQLPPQLQPQLPPQLPPQLQQQMPPLPPPPSMVPTFHPSASLPGMPDVTLQPGAANVIITPQGTRTVSPTGTTAMLPPGVPVGPDVLYGRPEPPPAPPGVANIVLPPGGGMTNETLAALTSRSNDTPPEPPTS